MPTLLRELLEEANIHTNGAIPGSQTITKATIIEPLDIEPNPALQTKYTSLMEPNNIITEPQARLKTRLTTTPPMSYQMNNQNNFSPNLNVAMLNNEMRNQSFQGAQQMYMNSAPPTAGLLMPQQIAGVSPPMRDVPSQPSLKIREGFRGRQQGQQSCIDTLNHISSCPMCSRYFECDAKVYHVIIFMLIVLFLTILYFVCKEEHKFSK